MTIQFSTKLNTYIAYDKRGVLLGKYSPKDHGTVEEFRNAMIALTA